MFAVECGLLHLRGQTADRLSGGEDYELLFTCSLDDYEKLIPVEDLYIIGHITKPEYGCNLIGRNGEELALKAQGWNAFNG